MNAEEMRRMYVKFFEERGHKEIASASLMPDGDTSVLFTTAGMHPLVRFLLGERHPMGRRLAGVQKCIRTDDIDEVGDGFHHTYFEMLGNWSLGDYFKEESIRMSYDFLTGAAGIPADRLAVTVFEGNEQIPKDTETYEKWKCLGIDESRIYYYGMEENWWGPVGETGPCGPDTEIFYDTGKECSRGGSGGDGNGGGGSSNNIHKCGPACGCGKFIEIWNNVFMQYNKLTDGSFAMLEQKNVDTGMSLERILTIMNRYESNYETDMLAPIINKIEELTCTACSNDNMREYRIIADHMRAVTYILADNKRIRPSNSGQGYILRRLIRRVIRLIKKLGVSDNIMREIADTVRLINASVYPVLSDNKEHIHEQLVYEYSLFSKTLERGLKEAGKVLNSLNEGDRLNGEAIFHLFDTFGFPPDFTGDLAREKGVSMDMEGFNKHLALHREKSRNGAREMFKAGLARGFEGIFEGGPAHG
jgi:alanyl-tRNA synthetase